MNVTIEKLVYGGDGLAREAGDTIFVPYVLPGESVRIGVAQKRKKFVRGSVEEILAPSSDRVSAPCRHFGICGGCNYQHMPYAAQLRYKTEILRETLARIAKIEWPGEIAVHASPEPLHYRNRAQWAVRRLGDPPRPQIGYFQQASSVLVPATMCPISSPRLETALGKFRDALSQGHLRWPIRAIEAFTDERDEKLLLNVTVSKLKGSAKALAEDIDAILPDVETMLVLTEEEGPLELFGPGFITYRAAGHAFRVGNLSFFQVNRFIIDDLVRGVTEGAKGELALDLFSGVGLFSLPLARNFARVISVEGNVAATRDLEENLKPAPNARARRADVESFLERWRDKPDLVVLDPPRAGVDADALERLRALGPKSIRYLSCDPATLARDLAVLTKPSGTGSPFSIRAITLYDIFPQTYHIEALVTLERLD
ncbi:MAG TPA: 23S rRNA (uracil(1939)-C(5))-methyltransferase RlmD [Candidatus Acidoferrales bacterium]|nr:23S rRNA (uracil(1939)-C(5))-methyltransferase RlmD [Candidatus Acidoferrales bacterium]